MDADLIARAVKLGLVLTKCGACIVCDDDCDEHCAGDCVCFECHRMHEICAHGDICPACDGTGKDRTPWAIVGAVRMSTDYTSRLLAQRWAWS